MKKILIIIGGFTYGGTIFSTLNMISFLKTKYDIYIQPMIPYGPVREYYHEYNILKSSPQLITAVHGSIKNEKNIVTKTKLFFFKGLNSICKLLGISFSELVYKHEAKRIMNKYHFDFVASSQEGISTAFAIHFIGAKRIAWFRTEYSIYKDQLSQKEQQERKKTYHSFEQIVCVSQTTRDDFCKYFEDIQEKVVAIHNIQNTDNILLKSKEPITDDFNRDNFNIVSVGRIAKQKQFYLIPMIADLLKNKYHLSFRWYIIGDGDLHGERERLEAALNKYNNRDYVICMGSRLNPYPYIASADLLVNTSYYEACPRVVAEAKILHTPVVCADFSSAQEFVNNDVDGFVGTIDELPSIIANLISDKGLYNRIKDVCNNYSIDNAAIMKQLIAVFS